jgi:uncharacterized protein (DUF1697 family)
MVSRSVRFLALVRGVNNIGQTNRVAMADLRTMFEGLGYRDVRTLLNSGNVIFTPLTKRRSDILARIQKALASELQLKSPVILLSADEVAAAVHDNPLCEIATNPSHLLVVVPRAQSDLARLQPLLLEQWAPEALALGSRVAYVWCANGIPRSPLWTATDRALERSGTVRNIATFTKALALLEPLSSKQDGMTKGSR